MRGYRQKKARKQFMKGLAAGGIALVAVAAVLYINRHSDKLEWNPETRCAVGGPSAVTAILIDNSDPFTPEQRRWLKRVFEDLVEQTTLNEELAIYQTSNWSLEGGFTAIASACNPGDPDDVNPWTGNPDIVRREWNENFLQPLNGALAQVIEPGVSLDSSPIMQMIRSMVLDVFPIERAGMPLQIVVVSDMLEHTPSYSHYRDGMDIDSDAAREAARRAGADLSGVQVHLLYLMRPSVIALQTEEHRDFWREYILRLGGQVIIEDGA